MDLESNSVGFLEYDKVSVMVPILNEENFKKLLDEVKK